MVWETLTDNPEVVYGAVLALVIVVLLTPAVGGMARMLGAVDRPGARRVNRGSVPRLGGLALFFGIFVPALAFLPLGQETKGLLLGMAVATTVGAIDDFRGLVWWEKLGGQIAAAAIPTGFGIWVHRFTFPILGVHALPEWVGIPLTIAWIVAIMNMVNFLDGLDGLAAGVCAISGGTFCVIALSLGRPDTAILAAIVLGACLGFLRHNFYPARIFMGDSGALLLGFTLGALADPGPLEDGRRRHAALPAARAGGADHRHLVRGRQADQVRAAGLRGRQDAPAPPLPEHRLLAAARSADDVGLVRDPRRRGAGDALHPPARARRLADGPTLAVASIGALALGASIYMVYLLEIVKLANPRIRRREAEARAAAERRSA